MRDPVQAYDDMRGEYLNCWLCQRTANWSDKPVWWHAPWMLERHHFARHPRVADRRAVVYLCSLCHRLQHGDRFTQVTRRMLTLAELLWIKRRQDPEFYDRVWLARHVIGRLPRAKTPTTN